MSSSLSRIQSMNREMELLEHDITFLKNCLVQLGEISERKSKLETYYYDHWLSDKEKHPDEMYAILSEDGLYNMLFDVDTTKKDILKFLVSEL